MTVFFISDSHFYHANIIKFTNDEGRPIRLKADGQPFSCVEEMNEHMVEQWNKTVGPTDKVYHLGDFAFGRGPSIAGRLNGHKRIVLGNHDKFKPKEYAAYFEKVLGAAAFNGVICTHIPVHEESLGRWGFNLHGHLHGGEVKIFDEDAWDQAGFPKTPSDFYSPDLRYFNVSVERINYTPISADEIMKITGRKIL